MFIEASCLHPPPRTLPPHPPHTQEAMVVPSSPGESHHSASLQPPPHFSRLCQSMCSAAPLSAPHIWGRLGLPTQGPSYIPMPGL